MTHKFIIIAAMGNRREIGINKPNHFDLPGWHLPNDTKRFTKMIKGKVIIVGSNTFEAILGQTEDHKPYKDCITVVLTKTNRIVKFKNTYYTHNFVDAAKLATKESAGKNIYILGGTQIYKHFIKTADELDITFVDGIFKNANVLFPKFNLKDWELIKQSKKYISKNHSHKYFYAKFKRKK